MEHYPAIKEDMLLMWTTTWIHPKNIAGRQNAEQRHDHRGDVGSWRGSGMRDMGERKAVQGTLRSDKNVPYRDCGGGDCVVVNTETHCDATENWCFIICKLDLAKA